MDSSNTAQQSAIEPSLQRGATTSPTPSDPTSPTLSRVASPVSPVNSDQKAAASVGTCGRCQKSILSSDTLVRCLVCSTASKPSVIGNVCAQCYQIGVYGPAHAHDKSFLSAASDAPVADTGLPNGLWTVRRNAYQRLWYEHVATKMRTHIRPMTAVCTLPAGWQLVRDPAGKMFYRDAAGQVVTQHPNGLPAGWREAKDPDGKVFFINDQLQLASWSRPDEQPIVALPSSPPSVSQASSDDQATLGARPPVSRIQTAPAPSVQASTPSMQIPPLSGQTPSQAAATITRPQTTMALQTVQVIPRPTLRTATEATVNLLDPSHGSVIRQSRIAGHIAGQGIISSVNAIKRNKPLQDFARGTGIALANRTVKRAWRKAAAEVDAAYAPRTRKVELVVTNAPIGAVSGQAGSIEEIDDGYNGEYEVEYDDGTVVQFGADGKPMRVVSKSQTTSSVTSPTGGPPSPPALSRVSTGSSIDQTMRRGSVPARRPVGQQQSIAANQQQQQQMLRIQIQQQQLQAQQQELQRQMLIQQQQPSTVIIADPGLGSPPIYTEQTILVDPNAAILSGAGYQYTDTSQYVDIQGGVDITSGLDTVSIGGDSIGLGGDGGGGILGAFLS